ncbi:ATPase [Leptospira yasudae]|uniref:ATPase n=1 Tax=Leptospira yasudae TaxID=2202201 RepID=A0ABX9LYL9_9LEPT|nr:SRPBCC family protein [Leptospira yasudae]MBW0435641.1 SRPBCC domain-containing protein [Leptospira yasudae]RHX77938.1 ATPase [Leptospira yasudae]RHX94202.1 ATPase [Leptospira yasudae]TGK23190.1 ATPase [Leptospira yasudae]TGM00444.1 ATPase [Leptospira yasudae]
MSAKNNTSTADREIHATRIFNAPRDLVFKMWTEPEHINHWWGPRGFTNTFQEFDLKPGGVWRFIMHGPDGTDYPNLIVFLEIERPEKIVYKHGSDMEDHPGDFHVTVLFSEENGKTTLDMTMLFKTAEQRNETVEKYGAVEGLNQTMDRLAEYLAKQKV